MGKAIIYLFLFSFVFSFYFHLGFHFIFICVFISLCCYWFSCISGPWKTKMKKLEEMFT